MPSGTLAPLCCTPVKRTETPHGSYQNAKNPTLRERSWRQETLNDGAVETVGIGCWMLKIKIMLNTARKRLAKKKSLLWLQSCAPKIRISSLLRQNGQQKSIFSSECLTSLKMLSTTRSIYYIICLNRNLHCRVWHHWPPSPWCNLFRKGRRHAQRPNIKILRVRKSHCTSFF